jgi:hypothetical protein
VRRQKAAASEAAHADDLDFIERYLEFRQSGFLQSIAKCFINGWTLSEKQAEIYAQIRKETDFAELEKRGEDAAKQFDEVLQIIERLDRVSYGQYPSNAFTSIRTQFARTGSVTPRQLELLKKHAHRFRRQIGKRK